MSKINIKVESQSKALEALLRKALEPVMQKLPDETYISIKIRNGGSTLFAPPLPKNVIDEIIHITDECICKYLVNNVWLMVR